MTVSLAKVAPSILDRALALDLDATYSVFLLEYANRDIGHMTAIVSGRTAKHMLLSSTTPDLLEFHLTN